MLKKQKSKRPRIRRKVGFLFVNLLFSVLAFSAEEYPQCSNPFPDEFLDFSGLQRGPTIDVFTPSSDLLLGLGSEMTLCCLPSEILFSSVHIVPSVLRC